MNLRAAVVNRCRSLCEFINPPPIVSPYLYTEFRKVFPEILGDEVRKCRPLHAIEFGCLGGYSTAIIARNLPPGGHLVSIDRFDRVPMAKVRANLRAAGVADRVTLVEGNIFKWVQDPSEFNFMWVDVGNDADVIDAVHGAAREQILAGATVLFEGGADSRDCAFLERGRTPIGCALAPYEVICALDPGISRLLA